MTRLTAHLRRWLGAWPPTADLTVVAHPPRGAPGWDGRRHPLVGVSDGTRAVVSVPPGTVAEVRAILAGVVPTDGQPPREVGRELGEVLGMPDVVLGRGVFRWSDRPALLPPVGRWVRPDAPGVPAWLRPFNHEVLVVRGPDGRCVAGAGVKAHDDAGHEIAVVTEPWARGQGLARRLTVTAARRIIAHGRVPTYLHDPDNTASARVADAAGFPDRGWSVYGLFPG